MDQPLVLVVDDEQDVRESLVDYLRRALEGVAVIGASGAMEAKQMLQLSHIDLVLTDHYMPDGKGTDLLAFAQENNPNCTRMLMTAFPESDVLIAACNAAHVDHIFTKPMEPVDVANTIMRSLEDTQVLRDRRKAAMERRL